MALIRGGNYTIDGHDFPVPTTNWEDNVVAPGLNGIPRLVTYRTHTWEWADLPQEFFSILARLYAKQQDTETQLTSIETDDYFVDDGDSEYVTKEYTDLVILSPGPKSRALAGYNSVTVQFEIFVMADSSYYSDL